MGTNKPEIVGDGVRFLRPRITIPRLPKSLRAVFALLLLAAVLVSAFYFLFFTYIRPNEFGIKEVKIGLNSGIQKKVYDPGAMFRVPGISNIHRFPRNVQVLELTDSEPNVEQPAHHFEHAANIQTSDGFFVTVDVTILYRIVDPYTLITTIGPGEAFYTTGILPRAEPMLKESLGELTTEEFYNSPVRTEKTEMARAALDAELKPKGMQVDHILIRYFRYSDEIQHNIEEKKLQDQLVFKNQSEKKAATEAAALMRVTQVGEMQVLLTLQEGNAYKTMKQAETELYTRSREAGADLLVKLAEAKRAELKNVAMQSVGVEKLVAMKMAEVLSGLDTIVVPVGGPNGFNPLNLQQIASLFGASGPPAGPAAVIDAARASGAPGQSPPVDVSTLFGAAPKVEVQQ
jgi:regulator of protease activity HflC (stomatin/prohibitin superfamily)